MIGLDTNVLVRYLTQDDAGQARRANRLMAEAAASGEPMHVSAIVLCETVWVLRWAYRIGKSDILQTLARILDTAQFSIEDPDACREALVLYKEGQGDFSDYLLGARNRRAGCSATVTFDRKLRGSDLFRAL